MSLFEFDQFFIKQRRDVREYFPAFKRAISTETDPIVTSRQFLQRGIIAIYAKRCISYRKSVSLTV